MMRHLAVLPVALPLGTAALLTATRHALPRRVLDMIALLVAAGVVIVCGMLVVHPTEAMPYWFGGWVPHAGPALGIAFAPDPAGAAFAGFAALVVVIAIVFAAAVLQPEQGIFHVLVLLFLAGMDGFSLTADLFNLFVFFELMGVAAFALTGWHADERGPLQGMMTFAVTNTIGVVALLLGTGLLYARTGSLNLASIGRALAGHPPDALVVVAFALVATGLLVKLAALPFHFWLPDAHAVAPTAVCALFSGVMVAMGAFGFARVYAAIFADVLIPSRLQTALGVLAAGGALVGALMALFQRHLKRLLAFSTVSHAGVLLAGVATLQPRGFAAAALHTAGHGLLKCALFLVAGVLLDRYATLDARRLHGRGREVPELATVWFLAVGGLLDLGPTPTGPSAHLLREAVRTAGIAWVDPVLGVATVISGAALLRVGAHIFLGIGEREAKDPEQGEQGEQEERESNRRAPRLAACVAPAAAIVIAFALRFVPGLPSAAARSAAALLHHDAWRAWILDRGVAPWPECPVPPVAATSGAIRGVLALVATTLLLAVRRGSAPERLLVDPLRALARPLERLHGGYVGDAVAWIGIGLAVLAFAVA